MKRSTPWAHKLYGRNKAVRGEGNEPRRTALGDESVHGLNLRPFKRDAVQYEADTADEDIYTEATADADAAEDASNESEAAYFEENEPTGEINENSEEGILFSDEEIKDGDEQEKALSDESFFEAEEEEVEEEADEEPKPKKRTVGDVRRDKVREKRRLTEKQKRVRARRKKLIRLVILSFVAIMLITAAALTYFMLIVDSIEIYGCTRYDANELVSASGLSVGKHMWLQRTDEAESRMEENSYIASAIVTRVYPDKLVINITEREEAAVLVGMNTQAVIDKEGYVLYIGARADYSGLIQISGMGSSGYHVNQRLGEESDFNSRTLITLLDAVYAAGLEAEIVSIDLGNPLSINMETASGVTIHLGQIDNAGEKLADFKTVLPTLKAKGFSADGTLDLSAQGDPVYSPERTAEPVPTPSVEPTDEADATMEPQATPTPATPAPSATPSRTPGVTDAFSG